MEIRKHSRFNTYAERNKMTTVTKPFADKYFSYPDILSPSPYAANPNIRVQHHPYESAFNCRPASTPGFGAAHGYAARPRQTRGLSRPSGSSWPKLSLPPSRQRRGTGGHPSPGAPRGLHAAAAAAPSRR